MSWFSNKLYFYLTLIDSVTADSNNLLLQIHLSTSSYARQSPSHHGAVLGLSLPDEAARLRDVCAESLNELYQCAILYLRYSKASCL
ncbi:hypothetical protein EJ05DRAFT_116880 [Pseudovirgaria hyperparasitica]|uniref:Uncharacterized protein n=1 Tax=Pseudovirgaria hyperparasitica TaxID=470096 RepID=A0A6A6VXN9_9PEZI|nr:uncharacterized protein EJ05DRAFT_116880 [Pseudovirgaria hyperparasitica]KAF2754945.1 hypothetical protein EJ05DRAFT_116880 [Pseudovirgaria hyperparasitica]